MLDKPVAAQRRGEAAEEPAVHLIRSDDEALAIAAALATDFAQDAGKRDRERILPWEELKRLSASGLLGITVPKAHGGAGASYVTLGRVVALIAAADPSIAQIPQSHFSAVDKLRVLAEEDLRSFILGEFLQGRLFGNATAEPGGKTSKEHKTRFTRLGDHFRIDGTKVYATGALFARWVSLTGTDEDGNDWNAYVPRETPGLEVVDDWDGFGQRITASGTVKLDGVLVDARFVYPRSARDERIHTASAVAQFIHVAIDLGIAKAALDDTIRFVSTLAHPARGSGIARAADDPIAVRDIGEVTVQYHAAEALQDRAGRLIDEAIVSGSEADAAKSLVAVAEAKILTTAVALTASSKLFELAGTQATHARHNLDRHWRNARTHTLHDGIRWKYHAVGNFYLNGQLADPWTMGHPYRPAPAE
ncbi:SfnB family sulfur acquisition oxidoreductase [Ancylobacter sp. Lp-2]|uniref:SfnB family sulfur acquisition oxidoreductase n=1 Tax=Ancylobacter sp. Lp-2 TaxID=2881339 RepID=UPI001E533270|nr:SfnB family sulfur acquisition oxidoreductase [Ancylobacter sp. Lp-2]MCB4768643.1 SfnB family sulfur acquisition oxidoreductase [Ancylobacter sp. Lp-2]